jgi:hypothetical protein
LYGACVTGWQCSVLEVMHAHSNIVAAAGCGVLRQNDAPTSCNVRSGQDTLHAVIFWLY